MRVPLIAGNWKMHKTQQEAARFVAGLVPLIAEVAGVEVALCPPFTALGATVEALRGSAVAVGAQDCFWEETGAYTGQVAPHMLKDAGCKYVIIGHSELRGRFGKEPADWTSQVRALFGETDATVNRKALAALAAGLAPIICLGETLQERDRGETDDVVREQARRALAGMTAEQVAGLVIAYEPVWAIGTGRTCDPDEANRVLGLIRTAARAAFADAAATLRIQYGGSVKPDNAAELMRQPEIDGALVGGASLEPVDFSAIVAAAGARGGDRR
ncbi:MAG TPA: triose-phosphate isomerase [Armatimonadota bacterium]|nr:triose-phosphate isomerase [Armatimonadota bacterium]